MLRRVVSLTCLFAALVPDGAAAATPCWRAPVHGVVVETFRAPACPYCAGNRGLEYAVPHASVVRAVAAGTVSWAGSVAGVKWVVVRHVDGLRATYGRLASSALSQGDRVLARSRVGTASGEFYFGVRSGERYVDPAPLIGKVVVRPRLVPIDGSTPRPAPVPTLRCGGESVGDR